MTWPVRVSTWRRRQSSPRQGIELLDQLEGLLTAGLPIDRALHILANASDSNELKAIVLRMVLEIEKGRTFGDTIADHPDLFDPLAVAMVRAGEEGGILPITMRRLVDYRLSSLEFKKFLLSSSIYPLILLAFGVFAVGGILIFVIPQFVEAYGDLSRANFAARMLSTLSSVVIDDGAYILVFLVAVIFGIARLLRSPKAKQRLQTLLLHFPVVGALIVKSELSRIFTTVGVLLGAGVPILKAVRLGRSLTPYADLDKIFLAAEKSLREGRGLARVLQSNTLIPRLAGQLAIVGEESGALDRMLIKIGDRFENEVRAKLRALLVIIEPALIISIGIVIGGIVVSMITAILSLNDLPL